MQDWDGGSFCLGPEPPWWFRKGVPPIARPGGGSGPLVMLRIFNYREASIIPNNHPALTGA